MRPSTAAPLRTAVETPTYLAAAKRAGLSQAERDAALDTLMADPEAGEIVRGSGGIRKVRIGKDDTGKSGDTASSPISWIGTRPSF